MPATPLDPDYPVAKGRRLRRLKRALKWTFAIWAFKSMGTVGRIIALLRYLRGKGRFRRAGGFIPEDNY